MYYIDTIKQACIICPIVALFISGIYFSIQYRTYGSVSKFRTFILYTFLLYCMASFFLVILPLPNPAEVATRKGPFTQWIPFYFVKIFLDDSGIVLSNPSTYFAALKSREFYQPVFNMILTVPLGCYLRYYFKCNTKKSLIISLMVTSFYEFTQLTGLYGIYPKPYRVCDIDDIIINTTGSMLGFFIASIFIKILPKREKIDERAIERGKSISAFRRLFAKVIDMFIVGIVGTIGITLNSMVIYALHSFGFFKAIFEKFHFISNMELVMIVFIGYGIVYIVYHLIIIFRFNGTTIGKSLAGIKVCDVDYNQPSKKRLIARFFMYIIWLVAIITIPLFIVNTISSIYINNIIWFFIRCLCFLILVFMPLILFIKINRKDEKKKILGYEYISKTRLVSCTKKM